jgi:hypothetical protein
MMPNKPENNRAGQAAYKARMESLGMIRVPFWIKKEHKDLIKEYIKSLNDGDNDGKQ